MKLFLANISPVKMFPEILETNKYYLESFYYMKYDIQLYFMKKAKMFLLDSGAFTFLASPKKAKMDIEEYVERYIEFIKTHNVSYFFEMDTDSVHGLDRVLQFRKKIEREVGRQCIPVWHKTRGLDAFKKMVDEYKYISIGGLVTKEITQKDYPYIQSLVNYANSRGTKVHGLGFTNLTWLPKIPFYSVDSTSYTSGNRFGIVYYFNGKTLKQYVNKSKRIDGNKSNKFNLMEWIRFQEYVDKNYERRY